ncbi:hypothetical protein AB0M39_40145 [Streptomyces sp. NPDC051907]|uniref:hypothetical protein n=1 Tax=Streptomyces sp. NPDC051907 TaxID=3155284 RepID=UPI00342226B0
MTDNRPGPCRQLSPGDPADQIDTGGRDRPGRVRDSRARDLAAIPAQTARAEGVPLTEIRLPASGRPSRKEAVAGLLQAMNLHVEAADRFRLHLADVLANPSLPVDGADMTQLVTHETGAAFFRRLHAHGYSETCTWDELCEILPEVYGEAQAASRPAFSEVDLADAVLAARKCRLAAAAEAFLKAAAPLWEFMGYVPGIAPDADA